MQERRRFKRLDVNLPVTLRCRGNLIPATVLNISCGGMCLFTDNPEVTDENNVEVIVDLSAAELDISVRGKIVRTTSGMQKKVGIRFTNLYSVGHKVLEKYIRRHGN